MSIEGLNKAIEAFQRGLVVEKQLLDKYGLQSRVINLRISYNPDGNDHFLFYSKGVRIENWAQNDNQEICFKNDGEPQIEVFSRRVKVHLMKETTQITSITFCGVDGKHVTLADKKSVMDWRFDVNTQFIFLTCIGASHFCHHV